jgi:hypothetical protein
VQSACALPDWVHRKVKEVAQKANKAKFEKALKKVSARKPESVDRL